MHGCYFPTGLSKRSALPLDTPQRCLGGAQDHKRATVRLHLLAGQRLGIKEVDEGIWLVSFIDYDLGYIDLEQRTLQPVDNPFGPRLSPMS